MNLRLSKSYLLYVERGPFQLIPQKITLFFTTQSWQACFKVLFNRVTTEGFISKYYDFIFFSHVFIVFLQIKSSKAKKIKHY